MPAAVKLAAPPRSPERARLAAAIERQADAVAQHERVTEAQQRLDGEYFDQLQPAVAEAREALAEARHGAPHALVEALLADEPAGSSAVAEAEEVLRQAEAKVAEARQARSMLADEAQRASHAGDQARRAVDEAVKVVVLQDPKAKAVLDEFFSTGRRVLKLAHIIRSFGAVTGVSDDSVGLHFRIGDMEMPGDRNRVLYKPEPNWAAALASLREDPDQPLPGLPPAEEEDDVGDGAAAAA